MVRNAIERPISHKVLARGSYWEGRGGGGVTAHGHKNFVFPNQESKEVRYSF